MPVKETPKSDAPGNLKKVSDAQRAEAIAFAISDAAGWNLHVDVVSCSYRGALGQRGPFRQPTKLTFELRPIDDDDSPDSIVVALRRVSDEDLSEAIARRLGKVAGEEYVAEIRDRRYSPGKRNTPIGRVSILLALRESEGRR